MTSLSCLTSPIVHIPESANIFMPKDRLELEKVELMVTLSIEPQRAESIFGAISPQESSGHVSVISSMPVYNTYAKQIILTEMREYISQYSIGEISSSIEMVNNDLRKRITDAIKLRTPFNVRYVGLTNIQYPKIITDAQKNAAERREQIQQEEAQLEISKVTLERELQEARLRRAIEKEKAETGGGGPKDTVCYY